MPRSIADCAWSRAALLLGAAACSSAAQPGGGDMLRAGPPAAGDGASAPVVVPPTPRVPAAAPTSDLPGPGAPARPPMPTMYVAAAGSDAGDGSAAAPFATIQHALDVLGSGQISVGPGTYHERLVIPAGPRDASTPLLLSARPGATVTSAGATGTPTDDLIYLEGASFVRIDGFTLIGGDPVSDASGIRVYGSGEQIALVNNDISGLRGESAMGITIYGTDGPGVSDVLIDNNQIHDCQPAPSEALVINGNVRSYQISHNLVRDVNNIGIDVVAGETWLTKALPGAGAVIGNEVLRANSNYDGSAAGIYVDGASNVVVEKNRVSESDFGIEVGAENRGIEASNVIVRDNFVYRNYRGGIIFGGYDQGRGRVLSALFGHNSLYQNARPGEKTAQGFAGEQNGELIAQFSSGCSAQNNIFYGAAGADELVAYWGEGSVRVDRNLYYPQSSGLLADDADLRIDDPGFLSPDTGDLHLAVDSPAIHAGRGLAAASTTDIDGDPRDPLTPDLGADELLDGR
jgi:parallel beta-helix repeat protein